VKKNLTRERVLSNTTEKRSSDEGNFVKKCKKLRENCRRGRLTRKNNWATRNTAKAPGDQKTTRLPEKTLVRKKFKSLPKIPGPYNGSPVGGGVLE